jgi:Protein of unknown function (DUF3106)
MRAKRCQFAFLLAGLGLVGLLALPAQAQRRGLGEGGQRNRMGRAYAERGRVPPRWLERLRDMPPAEQERFLQNNMRFQSLPPERQAEIRSHLRQWNQLSPEQREALRRRARVWQRIPPEERQEIRREILPQWRQMSPDRRRLVVQRLRQLRQMDPQQRQRMLKDPAFMRGLHPDEQKILRKLSDLRLGPARAPAP